LIKVFKSSGASKVVIAAAKVVIPSVIALALCACATQPPKRTLNLVDKKEWSVGQGPLLSELISLPQQSVVDVARAGQPVQPPKGKFETDEEYAKRIAGRPRAVFIVVPVITTKEQNCETRFDHAASKYIVSKCLPFLSGRVTEQVRTEGQPLRLANAFDSRTIKRIRDEKYYLQVSVGWNQQFDVSREVAKELDGDLMAGVVIDEISYGTPTCRICAMRDLADSLSRNPSSGGWRNDAFKQGVIYEDWDYSIGALSVKRMVVFRKSDSRVLYDASYALSGQPTQL
jgi:hypothetical protein